MDCKNSLDNTSTRRVWKYEVFLSFRGEDTRNNFTDHLFVALKRKGVSVFKDDKELKKGKAISPELLNAIEGSQIVIVIFSRTYASSTWCLKELAKIAEVADSSGQIVVPVFYNVDPSMVRKQRGDYEKFFAELKKRFEEDEVQRWRQAMFKVASLSGYDVQNKSESQVIDNIVHDAISMLDHKLSSLANDLVGTQSRVEALENLLDLESNDDYVRVVGISGMGGIGKTTLAAVLRNKISHQFDACCFLMDVKKGSKSNTDLVHLQKQLLFNSLKEENPKIWDPYEGTDLLGTRLKHLKILIVLDDVDESKQLENLVGNRDWFGSGSRIVITTRDEHILQEYGVDHIYKVKPLNDVEVIELLCIKAFKRDNPMKGFEEVTYRVVQYVKGLPLAAQVLGSFLFGKDVSEWEDELRRLQENPKPKIMDVLQTSYNELEKLEKEIFLDIACFFNGMCCDRVMRILDCCGFYPKIGIRILIDKSLLIILENKIYMHDLLQKLGRNIVRESALNEARKLSRLWHYKDFYQVMMDNKETEYVQAIVLDLKDEPDTLLGAEALANINHLRLLIFHNANFSGSLKCLSNQLKYLEWHDYPFTYLPSNFQPSTLVELNMPNSYIRQLWGNKKLSQPLPKLESLDLHDSKDLIKVTDLELFPKLEHLNLEGCTSLRQVDESIATLSKLRYLNLSGCKNLLTLPLGISGLSFLEDLSLSGCSKLTKQLEETRKKEELDKGETPWQSIVHRSFWSPLDFFYTRHRGTAGFSLASLPNLPSLRRLNLSYCDLSEIPDSLVLLHHLERLNLDGNTFKSIPSTINKLSKLTFLSFNHCKNLKSLPELPSTFGTSRVSIEEPSNIWRAKFPRRFRLHMLSCPNLTETERCSSWALEWVINRVAQIFLHEETSIRDERCVPWSTIRGYRYDRFIVPGSEIPRWFSNQSLGPSIRIPIPPKVLEEDRNFLCLTFSAVFVAYHLDVGKSNDGLRERPWIQCDGHGLFSFIGFRTSIKSALTVGLDHLWLFFITRKKQPSVTGKFLDVMFEASPGLEIKKCGVHWLFKEDIPKLTLLSRILYNCGSGMQLQIDEALEMANKMLSDTSEEETMLDFVPSSTPSS